MEQEGQWHSKGLQSLHMASPHDNQRACVVYAVLIAQVLSVALATTGVSSQALTNQGVYAPTTQAFFNYCLLALVFGVGSIVIPFVKHKQQLKALRTGLDNAGSSNSTQAAAEAAAAAAKWCRLLRSWPSFAALALIDVEANVLVTKAYQYTSLTSVTLLDCFTIPCVMLLSWLLLRARYKTGHYAGAVSCIVGLAVLVLGDSQGHGGSGNRGSTGLTDVLKGGIAAAAGRDGGNSSSSSGSLPLLGDSLVLLGAMLYGVCNVTQELLLADVEPGQLLALLGVFGAVFSGAQAALLEHEMLLNTHWGSGAVLLPMVGFAAAMFAFYSLVPQVLMLGGATVLNLGLLTSDGWAALARYLWFGGFEGWSAYFFVASLLLVAGGLVVFTMSGSPKALGADEEQPGSGSIGRAGDQQAAPAVGSLAAGQCVGYSRLQTTGDLEDQHGLPSEHTPHTTNQQ